MPTLVRDAIEVLLVVALGGMLFAAAMRVRRGQVQVVRCPACDRPTSRAYAACPHCGAPTP